MRLTFKNLAALAVIFMAATTIAMSSRVQTLDPVTGIPLGKWSLSIRPYTGEGWDSVPVDVTSTTTDARKGLTAEKFLLRNITSRRVMSVKLQWYLLEKQQNTLLSRGETAPINADIPADGTFRLEYPAVTFAKIYQPLLKGAELTGNYVIEIAVGSITYEDGSMWEINRIFKDGKPTWENARNSGCPASTASSRHHVAAGFRTEPQCQDQNCYYCPNCGCYQCIEAAGSCCRVNSCTSCTSARCLKNGCQF